METLESLRRQIEAADDLRSVTKTMKGMAAVSIRRFETAVDALGSYLHTIDLGFRILLHVDPTALGTTVPTPAGPVVGVVVGTDQGLCGPINRDIARRTAAWFDEEGVHPEQRLVLAYGHRLTAELRAGGHRVTSSTNMPATVEGITTTVQAALVTLRRWQDERGVGRIVLFHHRPVGRTGFEPRVVQVVPLDTARIRAAAEQAWPTRVLPTFYVDRRVLLAGLTEASVFAALFRAFAEALASEHASRLVTVQNAERNIEERLEALGARLHQLRQATITQELLEVVAGFEVLAGEAVRERRRRDLSDARTPPGSRR